MRSKAFFAVSFTNNGKPYVYKTLEGFDNAYALSRKLSEKFKGKLGVSVRPLNRPNLTGQARISAYKD